MLCPECGGSVEHVGVRSLQETYVFRCTRCGRRMQDPDDD
jgi:tRNA(Ile2) C34 agmatinyltransferase TiaS